ncbi:MAG: hypothetical protein ACR2NP_07300 [Pirellulaceae bacterium]
MDKALPREEYIEQAYLFAALGDRLAKNEPVQRLLGHIKHELLATTKLPMAIDYLLAELNHSGSMSEAMRNMPHYFTAFQSYLMWQAEDERARMDMLMVMTLLEHESKFRAESSDAVPLFFFQLEILCRNRLSYDDGLKAMADDPVYNEAWREWLLDARKKLGFVDIADLIYVHSQYYVDVEKDVEKHPETVLFGPREGRIALANRRKDPLYLFAALQRQLNYPEVPRPKKADPNEELLPRLVRTMEQLQTRIKLLEDEQREKGIDLSQFYPEPGKRPE